jgi:hypothetical protein
MNFAFIITAYLQLALVEQNIQRIRNEYKFLNNSPIVVVSTAEQDPGFAQLYEKYEEVYVIRYPDAPGSTGSTFKSRPNPAGNYISWRHEFLPARILLSLQKGVEFCRDVIGVDKVLHIHSDTHWKASKEQNLVEDISILDKAMIIADTSEAEESSSQLSKILPPMMHLHPEGLMLNLSKCSDNGYAFTFDKIFDQKSGFESHNFGSLEALLAQYAIYCLSGKNITKYDDVLPDEYFQNIYFRCCRPYHCETEYGLINLSGTQEDGK